MKNYKTEQRINIHTRPSLRQGIMCVQLLLALLLWSPAQAQTTQQPDVWDSFTSQMANSDNNTIAAKMDCRSQLRPAAEQKVSSSPMIYRNSP
jgi:DNA mismatch repair protein MutH